MKPANNAPGIHLRVRGTCPDRESARDTRSAVHGSVGRDFDLVAIPWAEVVGEPQAVVGAIESGFVFRVIGEPENKKHGRIAYTISFGFGDVALDLSFMPRVASNGLTAAPSAAATSGRGVAHPLTPMSQCDWPADATPCRCNPRELLPPDFMVRWSREQSTPAPTIQ